MVAQHKYLFSETMKNFEEAARYHEEFIKGLWKENPVFVAVLGMCPALAVTNTAINGLASDGRRYPFCTDLFKSVSFKFPQIYSKRSTHYYICDYNCNICYDRRFFATGFSSGNSQRTRCFCSLDCGQLPDLGQAGGIFI